MRCAICGAEAGRDRKGNTRVTCSPEHRRLHRANNTRRAARRRARARFERDEFQFPVETPEIAEVWRGIAFEDAAVPDDRFSGISFVGTHVMTASSAAWATL